MKQEQVVDACVEEVGDGSGYHLRPDDSLQTQHGVALVSHQAAALRCTSTYLVLEIAALQLIHESSL